MPFARRGTVNVRFVALLIFLPLASHWNLTVTPDAGDQVPFETFIVRPTSALPRILGRVRLTGDVGATWELLDPAARRSVLDWRGLAGRLPALLDTIAERVAHVTIEYCVV